MKPVSTKQAILFIVISLVQNSLQGKLNKRSADDRGKKQFAVHKDKKVAKIYSFSFSLIEKSVSFNI